MPDQVEPSRSASADGRLPSIDWLKPKSWPFSDDPDVLIGQYANLKRQVPLLYLLLIIIALATLAMMIDAVPLVVVIAGPAVFVVIGSARMIWWLWFLPSADAIGVAEARTLLHRTTLAVIPICLSYLGYSFLLDHFGDASQRAGVAICLVMTAIGCIFCLMHLPQAALLVNLTTMVPYAAYQLAMGNRTFFLASLVAGMVTTLMIRVSLNAHEGFTELITSRAELASQRGEAERLARENARLAMTDALTGMANRRLFLSRLEEWVQSPAKFADGFVVGILDLDRFKPVNDVYGHAVGVQLLVEVGQRLRSIGSERMLVARLGGDEFGLLVDGDAAFAEAIGRQIITLLHQPFHIDGHALSLGGSIGFATFPDTGNSASSIFDRADYALYDVKADKRGAFAFFTPDLETRLRAETELETALLGADLTRELAVMLQPIVCLDSGRVCSVEALARWDSPVVGKVDTARFIEVAERLNLMSTITAALFAKALASMAALPHDLGLSFNLSTRDIVTSATIDMLICAIDAHAIAPQRITFEITETALMQDFETAIIHIERLRTLGAAIALDDFGTGFSSLSYLGRLPIDKVKIDRSFVCSLARPGVRKIVTAILGLCETLELQCIAEGVETRDDWMTLKSMGCHMAQGYVFARPMILSDLKDLLAKESRQAGRMAAPVGLAGHPAFLALQRRYSSQAGGG